MGHVQLSAAGSTDFRGGAFRVAWARRSRAPAHNGRDTVNGWLLEDGRRHLSMAIDRKRRHAAPCRTCAASRRLGSRPESKRRGRCSSALMRILGALSKPGLMYVRGAALPLPRHRWSEFALRRRRDRLSLVPSTARSRTTRGQLLTIQDALASEGPGLRWLTVHASAWVPDRLSRSSRPEDRQEDDERRDQDRSRRKSDQRGLVGPSPSSALSQPMRRLPRESRGPAIARHPARRGPPGWRSGAAAALERVRTSAVFPAPRVARELVKVAFRDSTPTAARLHAASLTTIPDTRTPHSRTPDRETSCAAAWGRSAPPVCPANKACGPSVCLRRRSAGRATSSRSSQWSPSIADALPRLRVPTRVGRRTESQTTRLLVFVRAAPTRQLAMRNLKVGHPLASPA